MEEYRPVPRISQVETDQNCVSLHEATARVYSAAMADSFVIANGEKRPTQLPSTVEGFLVSQGLLARSVVVELNGEALAPSEFSSKSLKEGDRLEIVRIVAGG